MAKKQFAPKHNHSLGECIAAFTTARQAMGVTVRTLDYYAATLPPFVEWCESHGAPTIDAVCAGGDEHLPVGAADGA